MAAKASNKMVMFLNLVLMLSLLLIISITEARIFAGKKATDATIDCQAVYGVISGDTCFDVAKFFNLTTVEFSAINPNLDCNKLFVGEWLCVEGSSN